MLATWRHNHVIATEYYEQCCLLWKTRKQCCLLWKTRASFVLPF